MIAGARVIAGRRVIAGARVIVGRRAFACGLAVLVAGAVTACGGGASNNGLQSKSPQAILAATRKAAASLKSVHVSGSITEAGSHIQLDLTLESGVGSQGSLSEQGKSFKLVVDRGTVYVNASYAFWKAQSNATIAKLMQGRWLKTSATGAFAALANFGSATKLFDAVAKGHGKLVKGGTATIRGMKAVSVRDTAKGGILYVALVGKPYPLELAGTGKGTAGKLSFTDFNKSVTITPPRRALDLAALEKLGG